MKGGLLWKAIDEEETDAAVLHAADDVLYVVALAPGLQQRAGEARVATKGDTHAELGFVQSRRQTVQTRRRVQRPGALWRLQARNQLLLAKEEIQLRKAMVAVVRAAGASVPSCAEPATAAAHQPVFALPL